MDSNQIRLLKENFDNVGPFNSQEIEKFQKMIVSDLEPDSSTISKIKWQLKNVDLLELLDKLWKFMACLEIHCWSKIFYD